jgi:hypothetical protein
MFFPADRKARSSFTRLFAFGILKPDLPGLHTGHRRLLSGVLSWIGMRGFKAIFSSAQGIEAEIPETLPQVKSRNWSGKPGFLRQQKMRPN